MVRVKNRYLVVEFLYPTSNPTLGALPAALAFHGPTSDFLTPGLLSKSIRNAIEGLFGQIGLGQVGNTLAVKYLSTATSTAIVRCPRHAFRLVWAALTCTTSLPAPVRGSVVVRVVRVSGTIRKAEEEVVRRAKKIVGRATGVEGDDVVMGVLGLGKEVGRGGEGLNVDDDDDDEEDDEDLGDGG
ncbi:hypothetical protein P152DRAFT_483867 [Eremomyces bilateralis CBS 781.70]|uniref:Uncharacterized protein n=1 Tax=Eremomyces bilateralis CBS 781.70 TaxID=1392243 RepID=A0A6G1FXJ4_9PEZI|nr:uncharacterized protein P152DRAFT_483867 [Eremomyces bilateralis CBS 781.70]KAF1810401.1 hypothetical protein P152DRAFT_483867 [Eremomyces bilateralis CBS 781.70]